MRTPLAHRSLHALRPSSMHVLSAVQESRSYGGMAEAARLRVVMDIWMEDCMMEVAATAVEAVIL